VTARAVVTIVLMSATLGRVAAQQPTFSSRREAVSVDVLVTDRGRTVRGLKAADFELLDSGVAQQVDLVDFGNLPLSVMLALDGSASVTAGELQHLRDAGRALLAGLRPDDDASLLTFADRVTLHRAPTTDVHSVQSALDALTPTPASSTGGTALVDATYAAIALAGADTSRKLLITFTDGLDTSSWLIADRVLEAARRSNVVTYAISTAKLPGGSFLRDLSDATGGETIEIASSGDLRATFVRILEEFRGRYLLSYSPANVPKPGWHPLAVRVKGRRLDIRARAGYVK